MRIRSLTATFAVAVLLSAVAAPAQAGVEDPLNFKLGRGSVTPKESVPDSVDPQRFIFRFRATRATPLSIRVVNLAKGRTVRRFETGPVRPGRWIRQDWNGLDAKGRLVAAGKYRVLAGPVGGPLRKLSRLRLHAHEFPIAGPHGTRGSIGESALPGAAVGSTRVSTRQPPAARRSSHSVPERSSRRQTIRS